MTRDVTSKYCWMVAEVLPCENEIHIKRVGHSVFCDLLSGTVVDQMVLDPVSCPEEIQCTADFALRNGKFSRLGG